MDTKVFATQDRRSAKGRVATPAEPDMAAAQAYGAVECDRLDSASQKAVPGPIPSPGNSPRAPSHAQLADPSGTQQGCTISRWQAMVKAAAQVECGRLLDEGLLDKGLLNEVLAGLGRCDSTQELDYVQNCSLAFSGSMASAARLSRAFAWLNMMAEDGEFVMPSTRDSANVLRAKAAAALTVHDLAHRSNWNIGRDDADYCGDLNLQQTTFTWLHQLLGQFNVSSCQDHADLAEGLVRVPEYLQADLAQCCSNATRLRAILAKLIGAKPQDLEQAQAVLQQALKPGDRRGPGGDFRACNADAPVTEVRQLRPTAMPPPKVHAPIEPAPEIALPSLRDQHFSQQLGAGYARQQRPDEGGASAIRVRSLSDSVSQLQARWTLGEARKTFAAILAHINSCTFAALDVPNDYGHTPRAKARHALLSLRVPQPKAPRSLLSLCLFRTEAVALSPPSFGAADALGPFGVVALVWAVASSHRAGQADARATQQRLKEDYVMALARCLKDEEESTRIMPSINCWRGYAEQLVLILSGHGLELPVEQAYSIQRPRELLYTLGAVFHAELDDARPDAERAEKFCTSAMQQCDILIQQAHGTSSARVAEREEEGRKAAFDLRKLCSDLQWPPPPERLLKHYGVGPAEVL